jgi:hypothetical protein
MAVSAKGSMLARRPRAALGCILAILLFGCTKQDYQPVLTPAPSPGSGDRIAMYLARDLAPDEYTAIGQMTAVSCRQSGFDSYASEHDTIIELQRKAYAAGADGLLDTQCRSSNGPDLLNNCWQSVECAGTAIKLNPGSAASGAGQAPGVASGSGQRIRRQPLGPHPHQRACGRELQDSER